MYHDSNYVNCSSEALVPLNIVLKDGRDNVLLF